MKSYTLKKDLPDSKAWDVYFWISNQEAYYKDGNTENSYWTKEYVENNPEWFAEDISGWDKVLADWRDGDGLGYFSVSFKKYLKDNYEAPVKIETEPRNFACTYDYAGSKASWDDMLERISEPSTSTIHDFFTKNHSLYEQYELLKNSALYSKEDLKHAFEQARLTHPLIGFKHSTFEEYLTTIGLQSRTI